MKTLVCVIGQIRVPEITWKNFKRCVLDVFDADLAVCLNNSDKDNKFVSSAKYVFDYKNTSGCWASSFDKMNPGWRKLIDIPGDWISPIKEPIERKLTGGLLIFMRWFLYQNIKDIMTNYDRIIVTRSDYYWTELHPVLDNEHIWLPNGEFHGGLPDRHFVFPTKFAKAVLTIGEMENIEQTGDTMRRFYSQMRMPFLFNEEGFQYVRYVERGLIEHLGFFPFCMFLTSTTRGVPHPTLPGLRVVYPDELESGTEIIVWPFKIDHHHISKNGMFSGKLFKVEHVQS
jgi:hypothetical protein